MYVFEFHFCVPHVVVLLLQHHEQRQAVPGIGSRASGCLACVAAGAATGVSEGTELTLLQSKQNPVPAG